jgi:hypothetical protein
MSTRLLRERGASVQAEAEPETASHFGKFSAITRNKLSNP